MSKRVFTLRRDNIQQIAALTGEDPYMLELRYFQAEAAGRVIHINVEIVEEKN